MLEAGDTKSDLGDWRSGDKGDDMPRHSSCSLCVSPGDVVAVENDSAVVLTKGGVPSLLCTLYPGDLLDGSDGSDGVDGDDGWGEGIVGVVKADPPPPPPPPPNE